MTAETSAAPVARREPELAGQTVVVIGGSFGHRARDGAAAPAPRGPT